MNAKVTNGMKTLVNNRAAQAFGLGFFTSYLFKETKTLYAPIIFHASCVVGYVIIKSVYPRMYTLLSFLF